MIIELKRTESRTYQKG